MRFIIRTQIEPVNRISFDHYLRGSNMNLLETQNPGTDPEPLFVSLAIRFLIKKLSRTVRDKEIAQNEKRQACQFWSLKLVPGR